MNLHNNHWVGIVISNNQDGSLVVVYIDPMGNQLASEPNSELLISAIQELSPGANIIDLSSVNFRQQNNDYDCGPFTADNLVRLARYFSEYYGDNITAEKIKSEILDIPDSLSAENQRMEHSHIFNGDVESPVVEKDKNESEVEE
ncbi:MAG: Ulp1 family isopeptidase, partial [Rickettsiales bacterium]